jgi:hypothetical protein
VKDKNPYCSAVFKIDPPLMETVALVSFDAVVTFLLQAYNRFADQIADHRADQELSSEFERVGGVGVTLGNRWGSKVEVGVGRSIWFLFLLEPPPRRVFSDNPPMPQNLVFYLDGGHHTELTSGMLVSREACLAVLRAWLEKNEFPNSGASE